MNTAMWLNPQGVIGNSWFAREANFLSSRTSLLQMQLGFLCGMCVDMGRPVGPRMMSMAMSERGIRFSDIYNRVALGRNRCWASYFKKTISYI